MSELTREQAKTETWECMGKRLMRSGKVSTAWLDASGEEVYFRKVTGSPGRTYQLDVARDEDQIVIFGPVQWVGTFDADDPRRLEWEAKERADMAQLERDRMVAKDKTESAIADLVAPLREIYKRQVGPQRRAAFLMVVTEMVTR